MRTIHERFMRLAIDEARKGEGWTSPYPSVGCVIVKKGRVIALGHTQVQGKEHAEVNALEKMGRRARGATLYSTLEPCHQNDYREYDPCSQWIKRAGVRAVVWGARDPNPKNRGGSTRWLRSERIKVIGGVLEKDCRKLHEIFLVSIQKRRPFVFVSVAVTLDGKITWKKNEPLKKFSSPPSLKRVHHLRHIADGIMVGSRTFAIDNPHLTARFPRAKNPYRIIVDSRCVLTGHERVFDPHDGKVIVLTTAYAPLIRREELRGTGVTVLVIKEDQRGHIDLRQAMRQLYKQGLRSVMIEGGGGLIASALKARLVDKVFFWYAPLIVGGRDTPTPVEGDGIERFSDVVRLRAVEVQRVGEDVLIEGYC